MRAKLRSKAVVVVLGVVLLAACGGSGGDSSSDKAKTTPQGPVKLTFWTWVTDMDKVVALWNREHPEIQVTVSEQAAGDELVTKVLTANKAGNPPDLIQAEYQALPTLVTNEVAADIAGQVGSTKGSFAEGTWQLVTLGSQSVYAVPQDIGPMMLYYRQDLFDRLGLEVPQTWDEFAQLARTVRQKDPKRYLTTFSATDPGWFAGLAQQAGAQWWGVNGEAWKVSIDDQATRKVADYWGGLITGGAVDDQSMYTPQWNKAMNDGTLLAWPSAIWAPGVLNGIAPKTKGKWAMAPMPQWSAGERRTGFWGGSSTAIAAKSRNRDAAARFAIWLNTDPKAVEALIKTSGIYPAASAAQSGPALKEPPAFFPGQDDFYQRAAEIAGTAAGFTWGPNVNVTYSAYEDAFGKAIQRKSSFADAPKAMQEATVADMRKAGFSLSS
jgi:multiple sugar transport system substrate-binding protein